MYCFLVSLCKRIIVSPVPVDRTGEKLHSTFVNVDSRPFSVPLRCGHLSTIC